MNKKILTASMQELAPIISEVVQAGQEATITVTGNSMRPLWFHLQNNVTLTGCDPNRLKKGDVPLYRRADGRYVLHRIIRVHENTFDLAGDGQYTVEHGLEKFRVLAVTKGFTKGGRYYTVNNWIYRMYARIWMWALPIRKYLFAVYAKLKRVFK